MGVADVIARRSRCDGRMIGAVIVDPNNRIVATGYNGAPHGYDVEVGCTAWCPRMRNNRRTLDYSNCLSVHAESNAIAFADRRNYEGGTLYVTSACCWDCGKLVANSGIKRVVMRVWHADVHRDPDRTIAFIEECGLEVTVLRMNK
jgi:dCMP deaminase